MEKKYIFAKRYLNNKRKEHLKEWLILPVLQNSGKLWSYFISQKYHGEDEIQNCIWRLTGASRMIMSYFFHKGQTHPCVSETVLINTLDHFRTSLIHHPLAPALSKDPTVQGMGWAGSGCILGCSSQKVGVFLFSWYNPQGLPRAGYCSCKKSTTAYTRHGSN